MVWKGFPKAVKSTELKRFFQGAGQQHGEGPQAENSAKAQSQESPAREDHKTQQRASGFSWSKLAPAAMRETGEMPQDQGKDTSLAIIHIRNRAQFHCATTEFPTPIGKQVGDSAKTDGPIDGSICLSNKLQDYFLTFISHLY